MLPGHWLRGLSRSSENRCGRAGRKLLRRCGRKSVLVHGAKAAAEVRGESRCGMGAEAGVC
ncbi:unknown [Acetobacter sp. CAG:267]|nr:unknown [Acetobacter sp. CAG:267]